VTHEAGKAAQVQRPAVSVIMSVFNGEAYLESALRSILNQSVREFEFVIVDDGSKDRTAQILAAYAAADERIRLISRPNKGLIASLNEAASVSKAPFLARMDGDDVAHPKRFEAQLAEFERRPELVALGTQINVIDRRGGQSGKEQRFPVGADEVAANYPNGGPFIAHPTLMMRTDAFRQVGGYRAPFVAAEDLDLLYRLCRIGQIDNLREALLDYRVHGKNISIMGGYKQMLARVVLIELVEEHNLTGIDHLSRLTGPVNLGTIERDLAIPNLRERLVNRLVNFSFAYNPHVTGSSEGQALIIERFVALTVAGDPASLSVRHNIFWTTVKSLIRSRQWAWLIRFLRDIVAHRTRSA
jgi:glycosyltransferase involved in cell wall biosynthesis